MKIVSQAVLAFSALLSSSGLRAADVPPLDAGLRQCRALAEAQARLACYDALPLVAARVADTGMAAAPASTVPAAPMPAVAAASAPAPAAAAVPQAERFGLDAPTEALRAITSSLPGRFEGWGPNTRFVLANGQVWQVADGSSAFYVLHNPKVTVRKAFMSGYEMEVEGVNQMPRVRRVP